MHSFIKVDYEFSKDEINHWAYLKFQKLFYKYKLIFFYYYLVNNVKKNKLDTKKIDDEHQEKIKNILNHHSLKEQHKLNRPKKSSKKKGLKKIKVE